MLTVLYWGALSIGIFASCSGRIVAMWQDKLDVGRPLETLGVDIDIAEGGVEM